MIISSRGRFGSIGFRPLAVRVWPRTSVDKPIPDLLNVTMDTPLEISTDGRNIVVSPVRVHSEDAFAASLDRINKQFGHTLKRLGE